MEDKQAAAHSYCQSCYIQERIPFPFEDIPECNPQVISYHSNTYLFVISSCSLLLRFKALLSFRVPRATLLRSQTLHWVRNSCFNSLKTNGEQSNQGGKHSSHYKHPPTYIDPVSKILQPFIHAQPSQWECNK